MRHGFYLPEKNLLVLWSQKSACTAVAEWVSDGVLGQSNGNGSRVWLRDTYGIVEAEQAVGLIGQGVTSVAFVRHPFDRMLSGYLNKYVRYGRRPLRQWDDLERFAKTFYAQATRQPMHEAAKRYQGFTFVEYLDAIHRERARNENVVNGHFNVQYHEAYRVGAVMPDHVIRTESIEKELPAINERLGIRFTPNRSNVSLYGAKISGAEQINSIHMAQMDKLPSRESFLTQQTTSLALRAHDVDYRVLGYSETPGWKLELAV